MPFCTKCGVQFEGDGLLCPSCKSSNDSADTIKGPFEKFTDAFDTAYRII